MLASIYPMQMHVHMHKQTPSEHPHKISKTGYIYILYNHKQRKYFFSYHDVTSSNANNTPPTGALKAAATPAAHPHVTFPKHYINRK